MSRKKRRGNGVKTSNAELRANQPLPVQGINSITVKPIAEGQNIDAALDRSTLKVESLSKIKLPASQRRSKRRVVSLDITYQCKICHLAFSTEYILRQHLDYYGDPRYPCEQCDTKFTHKRQLESHISSAHGCPKRKFPFKCSVCNQMFFVSSHLRAHLFHYHEDCKQSVKMTEEDIVEVSTEPENVPTESLDSTTNSGTSVTASKKRPKKRKKFLREPPKWKRRAIRRVKQERAAARATALSTEPLERVTSLTTISPSPLKNEENESDERIRREETELVTMNALNPNILESKVEKTNQNEVTTTLDDPPICVISHVSHVPHSYMETEINEINYGDERNVCTDEESQRVSENKPADGENKDVERVTANEQVLSIHGEISRVPGSLLENAIEAITKRNDEMERMTSIQILNNDDKTGKDWGATANTIFKSQEQGTPQAYQYTTLELCEPINEVIQPLDAFWYGPPHEVEVLQLKDKGETMTGLTNCDMPHDSDENRATTNNAKDTTSSIATSGENESAVPPTDSQEITHEKTAEKALEIRNYEKENELRILYSCKDCYVPLARVVVPNTAKARNRSRKSRAEHLLTVIPSIVCDQMFVSKAMMFQHYRRHHLSSLDDKVHCVCGKGMSGQKALDFHFYRYCYKTVPAPTISTNSSGPCKPLDKNHGCAGCGEKFWVESCLRSHLYSCKSYINQKVQLLTKSESLVTVSGKHSCRVCHTEFSSEEKLLNHNKTYSGIATHQCFCGTMFPGDRLLRTHMKSAHAPNPLAKENCVCIICNQGFPNKRLERMHRIHFHRDQAHNREPETNNLSPPDSDDPGDDETSVNKCRVCNLVFSNKKRFIDHTIYYTKGEIINCKTCSAVFDGQYTAHHHNKTVHYAEDTRSAFTHHCNVCKEGFMYMEHLQAHMLHVHNTETTTTTRAGHNNEDKPQLQRRNSQPGMEYTCHVCDVRFATYDLLSAHETEFANDGEYLCNRCSKKCRTPALLLDHLTLNHSSNAMQGGVKCRRCNENFLTQRAWICHVKHFHRTEEPSEFYLEKNIASTEESGDMRYELIPTNESISSGVTYFKVKSSIDFPKPLVTLNDKKGAGEGGIFSLKSGTNTAKAEENRFMANGNGETSSNLEGRSDEVENPEDDDDVVIIDEYNEITIDVSINDEGKSKATDDEQVINANLNCDAGSIEVNDAEKTGPTNALCHLRNDRRRSNDEGWPCSICGYIFRSQAYLRKHMFVYEDSGQHMCEICGRRFRAAEFYREHKLRHSRMMKVLYYCSYCNEGFRMYQSMKMHVAHIHPRGLQDLLTAVKRKPLTQSPQEYQPTPPRARNQLSGSVYSRSFSPVAITAVKSMSQSLPAPRTDLHHHSDLPAKVFAKDNAPAPKPATINESPLLQKEFSDDEESTTYECPTCQENYSTVNQLDEHLTAIHSFRRDGTKLVKPSISSDTPLACDSCQSVFANESLLNAHKKLHSVKLAKIVKSSHLVIDTNASSIKSKDPKNEQPPVVIGRLFKLTEGDLLAMSKNSEKNNSPKISVTRVSVPNSEQRRFSLKITTPKKGNNAVTFRRSLANAAVPFKRLATTTAQKKTVPAMQLTLPIGNVYGWGKKKVADRLILPGVHAVQKKTNDTVQKPNSLLANAPKKTTNAAERQLNSPIITIDQRTENNKKVPAANALQMKPVITYDRQLKQGATKVARIPSTVQKQIIPLADKGAQLIPLAAYNQLKLSAMKDAQVRPETVDRPIKVIPITDAQLIPMTINNQLKSTAVKDAPLRPVSVRTQINPSPTKDVQLIPLTIHKQSKPSAMKNAHLRPVTVHRPIKPLAMKDARLIPLNADKQSKSYFVKDAKLRPLTVPRQIKQLSIKKVQLIPLSIQQSEPSVVKDAQLIPLTVRKQLGPAAAKHAQLIPLSQLKLSAVKKTESRPLTVCRQLKPLPTKDAQLTPLTVHKDSEPLAAAGIQLTRPVSKDRVLEPLPDKDVRPQPPTETNVQMNLPVAKNVPLEPVVGNDIQLKPQSADDMQIRLQILNMGRNFCLPVETKDPSLLKIERQKPPEQPSEVLKTTSSSSASRSVLKRDILNNLVTLPIDSTPAVAQMPIKIVKVESYSSAGSADWPDIHGQSESDACNTVFMNTNELTAHERSVDPSTSSGDPSVNKFSIAPTSPKNSINQLHQLVSTLPINSNNEIDTEAEESPFSTTFESVMMPVSTDEFLPEDKISDDTELERPDNPLVEPIAQKLPPTNCVIRQSVSVDQNSQANINRKRKNNRASHLSGTKRPKGVFDPIAYQELCRQHNLVPPTKPNKPKSTSNVSKSKTLSET